MNVASCETMITIGAHVALAREIARWCYNEVSFGRRGGENQARSFL